MFRFLPLSAGNWKDLVDLFGARGACGGCWCMYWRLNAGEYNAMKGEGNKKAFRKVVEGCSPGILAYAGDKAIGWCAIAPRREYIRLEKSRILKPVDEKEVWSIPCFFIAKDYRGKGISVNLLDAAVRFALERGATVIEGYPVDPRAGRMPDAFAWTGLAASFSKAGFKEVARRSETRPIMRYRKD